MVLANRDTKPGNMGACSLVKVEEQVIEDSFHSTLRDVACKTLISGCKTACKGVVVGVATFLPNGILHPHRHTQPEFYDVLEGSGEVVLASATYSVDHGTAIYIPADVEPGVSVDPDGLSFVYGFEQDASSGIEHRFVA
ncbi:hypothetical protein GCM10007385_31070 [Tateyamaria omphalii]|nr:hypothetical protein GCM10007385_31070 [Tateyamaria omphalii]